MQVARCSEQSVCVRCGQSLAVGAWAIKQAPYDWSKAPDPAWFHLACAVDVSSYWARIALDVCNEPVDGIDALRALASERESARMAAVRSRSSVGTIEPARDPFGRPRVTALFTGSAFSQRVWDQFAAKVLYRTWRSTQREYVFAWIGSLERWQDPSRPVTAGIFAVDVEKKVVKAQVDRLRELYEMGVGSPVIWLVGASTSAGREAYFREQLARAGFDGDESIVLKGPAELGAKSEYPAALLDPLCEALDHCRVVRPRGG